MSRFIRKDLKDEKNYDAFAPEFKIKLDANESFMNVSENIKNKFIDEISKCLFNRYPDSDSSKVCGLYARYAGVKPCNIIAGNGSDELISIIFDCFIEPGETVVTVSPDFSMYEIYIRKSRGNIAALELNDDFMLDADEIIDKVQSSDAKILIFSNPNNPTGRTMKLKDIERILSECSCLTVIDEAYFEFNDDSSAGLIDRFDNLLVLRTCSKAIGIPSLRLGFAIGCEELIEDLKKVKPPYNVSALTQKMGEIVLEDTAFIRENIDSILNERDFLYDGLKEIKNIKVIESKSNYLLIKVNNSGRIYNELINNGILVRKFSDGRLSDYLRITVGSRTENEAILSLLKRLC